MRVTRRSAISLLAILFSFTALAGAAKAQPREPIRYTFRVIDAAKHIAEVDARFPLSGQSSLDLMMPVWTPGFYRVEDYAARVQSLVARTPEGVTLDVTKPRPNRWQITTNGSTAVVVTYRLLCQGRSVTTTWVDAGLGVINGAATFITTADRTPRPHEVLIDLPATWPASISGLEPAPGGQPNHYRAADFDTLVDSPIVAGTIDTRQFVVDGSTHVIADAGDYPDWDGGQAAKELEKMVRETRRFWGFLPFKRYVFLNVFRQGGGGLEHANSTLLTSSPKSTKPTQGWLSFVAHEYLHAFNVKRLRPIELGPFDYETPPVTTSLWLSEGATTYVANLVLSRAGLMTHEDYLGSMSSAISDLQKSPGRLVQSLEQSSAEVWTNSNSGVAASKGTVSYYGKGNVVAFLLDAHIRRLTDGSKSFDDAMRLAYQRYGGDRGFTADELRATFEEVAGRNLKPWFARAIGAPGELDYGEMLGWYGLRFAGGPGTTGDHSWSLEVRPRATAAQRKHLAALLASPSRTR
jgi:predicted metalloprotease with PDZ domain